MDSLTHGHHPRNADAARDAAVVLNASERATRIWDDEHSKIGGQQESFLTGDKAGRSKIICGREEEGCGTVD